MLLTVVVVAAVGGILSQMGPLLRAAGQDPAIADGEPAVSLLPAWRKLCQGCRWRAPALHVPRQRDAHAAPARLNPASPTFVCRGAGCGRYLRLLTPALFFMGTFEALKRYLYAQAREDALPRGGKDFLPQACPLPPCAPCASPTSRLAPLSCRARFAQPHG